MQLITYRLADALPVEVVRKIEQIAQDDKAQRLALEKFLDAGFGSCVLRNDENAALVLQNWLHFENRRYFLHAWVIMPNHVHVLIEPLAGWTLSEIVQSWKSYTAKAMLAGSAGRRPAPRMNAGQRPALPGLGARRLWQPDYHDRYIRSEAHYQATVHYIHQNPVRAGLVKSPLEWRWSSMPRP